ncbi:MAG: GTPase Era [Pseudomonadota bacterium]
MSDAAGQPRFGYVALVGRPNVGKSTLLNALLEQKISITAHKPQTTRHQILGICHDPAGQIVFVDTPGMHVVKAGDSAMNRYMNRMADSVTADVNLVAWLVDARGLTQADEAIGRRLKQREVPLYVVINKIDLVSDKTTLLPLTERLAEEYSPAEIVPVSARRGDALDTLKTALLAGLPEGAPEYGEDEITNRSSRFIATEFIREQVTRRLHQELPYAATVDIDMFRQESQVLHIAATIFVEREGQKGIVIGNRGETLKGIGTAARRSLETFFGCRVNLKLWVKVRKGWSDDERALQHLGYRD